MQRLWKRLSDMVTQWRNNTSCRLHSTEVGKRVWEQAALECHNCSIHTLHVTLRTARLITVCSTDVSLCLGCFGFHFCAEYKWKDVCFNVAASEKERGNKKTIIKMSSPGIHPEHIYFMPPLHKSSRVFQQQDHTGETMHRKRTENQQRQDA